MRTNLYAHKPNHRQFHLEIRDNLRGLTFSDRTERIKELQQLLQTRIRFIEGFEVNGVFDKPTKLAVKAFQMRNFLDNHGIIDSHTWKALRQGRRQNLPTLRFTSCGGDVARVQKALSWKHPGFSNGYYFEEIHGDFNLRTEVALKMFQRDQKLVIDGIIGDKTWEAMMALASVMSYIKYL
ncbi:MAG: peptidoglycan-binding protein [Cyanobacteria bacterium P01_A01_bin.45]